MSSAGEEETTFTSRDVTLAVIPHVTGVLSLLGSTAIVVDVFYHRQFHKSVYHRLMLGLAGSDIIASIGFALSTWPIPKGSIESWGALGNLQSCEFQGFIIQLGLATTLYSAALSIYYMVYVKFNWRPESPEMARLEKASHVIAISLALGTAIASLALGLYNEANLWCWIAPMPMDCVNSIAAEDGVGTCIRGDNAWVYRMAFYFSWVWASFLVVVACMGIPCHYVYQQSCKMDRYRQAGESKNTQMWNQVKQVSFQASLYIVAFIVTALPVSIARLTQASFNCTETYFPLSLTTVCLFPLQGLWNALIYFRSRRSAGQSQGRPSASSTTNSTSSRRQSAIAKLFTKKSASMPDHSATTADGHAVLSRESATDRNYSVVEKSPCIYPDKMEDQDMTASEDHIQQGEEDHANFSGEDLYM